MSTHPYPYSISSAAEPTITTSGKQGIPSSAPVYYLDTETPAYNDAFGISEMRSFFGRGRVALPRHPSAYFRFGSGCGAGVYSRQSSSFGGVFIYYKYNRSWHAQQNESADMVKRGYTLSSILFSHFIDLLLAKEKTECKVTTKNQR
jgi:hypothetical protein